MDLGVCLCVPMCACVCCHVAVCVLCAWRGEDDTADTATVLGRMLQQTHTLLWKSTGVSVRCVKALAACVCVCCV